MPYYFKCLEQRDGKDMINGNTLVLAHIGYPTHSFKSPMIYNPWFESVGVNALVVPMACQTEHYEGFLRAVFTLDNIAGALITMPHKVATMSLLDGVSATAEVAGACNAVRRRPDGRLQGDMFDGEGFVRGAMRKGCVLNGARALVIGSGGVGSAIAASLAGAGVQGIALYDIRTDSAEALAMRLRTHYPHLAIETGSNDPDGFDIVVNASTIGMNEEDPLPVDVNRLASHAFVGEVVMRSEMTSFLSAAAARGCRFQVGTDMLFEQIPAYLEYFGLPTATPEQLRATAQLG